MSKVQFKFREDATVDDRQQLIDKLVEGGADAIERVFPDAPDEELAAFYTALIGDLEQTKLLRMLKRAKTVEFAEPQSERRLILPVDYHARNGSSRH